MKLSYPDLLVIGCYLAILVVIGLVMRKKAARNKEEYLLGGKSLPWYMLGLSNASGMFDISGTMWMVTIAFVYGLKSIWIPWLWPCFNQIFLMIYLAMWLRRSNVTTGAEWMTFRFGNDRGARLSHGIVVVFALLSCLGFLAYGFIGLGKFIEIFLPWEYVAPYFPFAVSPEYVPHVYGILFTLFSVFYSILGGMSSIVWADVIQYVIMTVSAVVIAVIAMIALSSSGLIVPEGWFNPFFGWTLDMDWTGIINDVNARIDADGYSLFGIFFMLMLFKGILASLAGPAPTYDMQKILSNRTPRDAARMSGIVSVVLFPTRYLMIMGFTVLGLLFYDRLDLSSAAGTDFERLLPAAISEFVPVGLKGILLAGLLSAFIGTFAGTLNTAQAYIVNDIYLKYLKPEASARQIKRVTYTTGVVVVLISIFMGIMARDVNSVLQWIVSGLFGGYIAANLLKWHWWRFNGNGFFYGMLSGIVPALFFPLIFPEGFLPLYYFPLILLLSLAGCIYGTYAAPVTAPEVLDHYYKQTNPWGIWGPVKERVAAAYPDFRPNCNFKRDVLNVGIGIVWQITLVTLPVYLVLMEWTPFVVSLALMLLTSWILKKNWYDKLGD